ncbi:MAG TPA: thiamine pyrophosphate-requiring protein [Acidobacteriaceae bacterium]|jgi:acetolactate synthase-1/2/3 large subunit
MYKASDAFLEALMEAEVSCVFANWGSDHPSILETIAEARADGRPTPRIVTCPNEMAGLSAAHGYYLMSGKAQAVIVHVECGTQSLGGAVHNAAKGRIPVLIFAGASPYTQNGEKRGSRNEFIQWIQDVHDQRGLVRGYTKYDNELRTGGNIKEIVHRAMQFAASDPCGPVYLMAAREVLEEETTPSSSPRNHWKPLGPLPLPSGGVEAIAAALEGASRPLVVTSYAGRKTGAAEQLTRLCNRLGIGVLESVPICMNYPHQDELYQGSQWNQQRQTPVLAQADVILVVDSDVPWIPTVNRPAENARIFHIDVDPLKEQMPLWHIPAEQAFRADAETALQQINEYLEGRVTDEVRISERRAFYNALHRERRSELEGLEAYPAGEAITSEYLVSCVRKRIDRDTIVLSESISEFHTVMNHLAMSRPGTIFSSGGGSLGWNGGAAVGAKLASPEKTVIAFTGDGSFMFSEPHAVHWMARRYNAPFLQIVLNNGGWKAPKLSALSLYPDTYVSKAESLDIEFAPAPDYGSIAAASGGAYARQVRRPEEVEGALDEALKAVKTEGRSAVLDVFIPRG